MEVQSNSKSLKLIIIILAVVILVTTSVIVFIFKDKLGITKLLTDDTEYSYDVGTIVVNLQDNKSNTYLKTKIAISYKGKKNASVMEEKSFQIRDSIVRTLRSKSKKEIESVEKTDELKIEIIANLNKVLGNEIISDVYITDFMIQ